MSTMTREAIGGTRADALGRLTCTTDDVSQLVLRLGLGIVMFPHGAQKVLGWFGGSGFQGTYQYFTQKAGIPGVLAVLVFAAELLGSIGLIVGLFSRIAAAGILLVMLGAIALVHWPNGFFMNWQGTKPGEGFEFHLLAIAIALAIIIRGSGPVSVDQAISRDRRP